MASGDKRETQSFIPGELVWSLWQRTDFGSRDNSDPEFGDCHSKVSGLKSMDVTLTIRKKDAPI